MQTAPTETPSRLDPNDPDVRAAMGLAPGLVERFPPEAVSAHRDVLGLDPEETAAVVEDLDAPVERRWLAGQILALVGDPRIDTFDPQLVSLPGGVASIGLPEEKVTTVTAAWYGVGVEESWIRKEAPRHEVAIAPFRMMKYPVTNSDYRAFCLDVAGAPRPSSWRYGMYPLVWSNHPVWTVPVEAADAYAAWLSERTGRSFRLPTEAQWEYAASGGEAREFPWGDEWDASRCNTVEAGPVASTPVGMFPSGASEHGILDLGGNAEEWVRDEYRPYPGSDVVVDDLVERVGEYRVTRGGCFTRFGDLARCARRHGWYGRDIYAVGFRLVEESEDEGSRGGGS
jgi:formylglycine-generating enzyme required for sulfatase activity